MSILNGGHSEGNIEALEQVFATLIIAEMWRKTKVSTREMALSQVLGLIQDKKGRNTNGKKAMTLTGMSLCAQSPSPHAQAYLTLRAQLCWPTSL